MAIIEFAGMPRSGKSSTAQGLKRYFPKLNLHPEFFEKVPDELKGDPFEINDWYAREVVKKLTKVTDKTTDHLFERSKNDRLVVGLANLRFGRFTDQQYRSYEKLLKGNMCTIDFLFVFNPDPQTSLQRSTSTTYHISRDPRYLRLLHEGYRRLLDEQPGAIPVPRHLTIPEQIEFCYGKLVDHIRQ
jgi:hypothetical protein